MKKGLFASFPSMDKTEKTIHFAHIVLKHDLLHGHLNWTIAGVAKEADYSRAWVYKQFSSTKSEILLSSLKLALDHQLVVSSEKEKKISEEGAVSVFMETRKSIAQYPEASMFVFKYYFSDTIYGETIRAYDKKYSEGLVRRHKLETKFQERFLRSLIHGIAVGPFLNQSDYISMAEAAMNPKLHEFLKELGPSSPS